MRKRLRKKFHLGEFREFGFEVAFRVADTVSDAELDNCFWDAFIDEAIEARGLSCGGGCGREWDIFVTRAGRQSATEEDRAAVGSWLKDRGSACGIRIGLLVDAWHIA
ncbi:MAG: YggL family protein [Deltaproteobacteria bacterium]|nr:YggL family protein [Deltaproteobacteria bacterium]